jgi:hypothetical protein
MARCWRGALLRQARRIPLLAASRCGLRGGLASHRADVRPAGGGEVLRLFVGTGRAERRHASRPPLDLEDAAGSRRTRARIREVFRGRAARFTDRLFSSLTA